MNNIVAPSSSSLPLKLARWWYVVAAPAEVPRDAPFKDREAVRRGKRASWILLVVILLVLLPIPAVLAQGEFPVFVILLIVTAVDLFALFLNRVKQTTIAGVLVLFTVEMGNALALLFLPGGAGPSNLPLLDSLAQGEIVAVALLAPGWVFAVMGLNIAIVVGILNSPTITPELAHLVKVNPNIYTQAIEIQIIIAIFAFILVRSADVAIKSLDRAEEIAILERKEIERQEEQLVLKHQLESGVEQLLQTHVRAANGDFSARAPLNQDNILWKVAYSLNNLLARLERYTQSETQVIRTHEALHMLAEQIRLAKATGQPIQFQRTGTPVDEVLVELYSGNASSLQQANPDKSTLLQQRSFNRATFSTRHAFARRE